MANSMLLCQSVSVATTTWPSGEALPVLCKEEALHYVAIHAVLKRAWVVRRMFIGQGAGSRKGGGGMAQREQKAVLADFRRGAFNTLVATCIGEEGLDIPQVLPVSQHASSFSSYADMMLS